MRTRVKIKTALLGITALSLLSCAAGRTPGEHIADITTTRLIPRGWAILTIASRGTRKNPRPAISAPCTEIPLARFLRSRSQGMQRICFSVPKLSSVEHQMKTQHHFEIESEDARREVAQIRTMIVDLDRVARFLASDIVIEEERSGAADRSDPAYPILARTLAARRDNLKVNSHSRTARGRNLSGIARNHRGVKKNPPGVSRRALVACQNSQADKSWQS